MMKVQSIAVFATILGLAGCGEASKPMGAPTQELLVESEAIYAPAASDMDGMALKRTSEAAMEEPAGGDIPQRAGLYLAYAHDRSIEVPSARLKPLIDAHAETCRAAGPQRCIVVNSNISGLGSQYASGSLFIKAAPDWATQFLDGLPDALEPSGAEVTSANTRATDLTAQIIDTDAQLNARTTLRDRLQTLLETRDGDLEELLAVERELARVQGQIDSYAATLANLRQRVAMSDISLSYQIKRTPVSRSVWRPLTDAFDNFFSHVAYALSGIVTLFAYLLPWTPVIAGLIWLLMFLMRRIRKRPGRTS